MNVTKGKKSTDGYVFHPLFQEKDAKRKVFRVRIDSPQNKGSWNESLSAISLGCDRNIPSEKNKLLTREEEYWLFLQYNYARFRLSKLRETQETRELNDKEKEMVDEYEKEFSRIQEMIVNSNLGIVVKLASKYSGELVDFAEAISIANEALINAIRNFDISRGFKFSTYAYTSIQRLIWRKVNQEEKLKRRNVEINEDYPSPFVSQQKHVRQAETAEFVDTFEQFKEETSDRERVILEGRMRTDGNQVKLEDLGKMLNITKERARQIEIALKKELVDILSEHEPQ